MKRTAALIIGAGQAGLATSRHLTDRGVDHVVLERDAIATRWRTERWDSLRLLTPNWQTRLPGWSYGGPEPDGFMRAVELADHLQRYAASFDAPVRCGVSVVRVEHASDRWRVTTNEDTWLVDDVIVATGQASRAHVPPMSAGAPVGIDHITPNAYRGPDQLGPGGVLVVGASASGAQIADELAGAGRAVTLAVGGHHRMPRTYRGADIMTWLDRIGHFDEVLSDVPGESPRGADRSLQLVGSSDRHDLDLARLHHGGVRLVGRMTALYNGRAVFADDLGANIVDSDARLHRLLAHIDARACLAADTTAIPQSLSWLGRGPRCESLDLRREGIGTIVWATGFRRDHSCLPQGVLDKDGELRHRHGITECPGLYAVGFRRQRTRKSTFVDGVGADAAVVVHHLLTRPRLRRTTAFGEVA